VLEAELKVSSTSHLDHRESHHAESLRSLNSTRCAWCDASLKGYVCQEHGWKQEQPMD
jgi:hypothetical protein